MALAGKRKSFPDKPLSHLVTWRTGATFPLASWGEGGAGGALRGAPPVPSEFTYGEVGRGLAKGPLGCGEGRAGHRAV